jgi:hypothetical protein
MFVPYDALTTDTVTFHPHQCACNSTGCPTACNSTGCPTPAQATGLYKLGAHTNASACLPRPRARCEECDGYGRRCYYHDQVRREWLALPDLRASVHSRPRPVARRPSYHVRHRSRQVRLYVGRAA